MRTDNVSYNCFMKKVVVFLLFASCLAPVETSVQDTTLNTSSNSTVCKNLNVENFINFTSSTRGSFGGSISFQFNIDNIFDEKNSNEGISASGLILLDEVIVNINYPVDQYITGSYCNQQINLTVGNSDVTGTIGDQKVDVVIEEGLDSSGNPYIGIIGTIEEQNFSVYNRSIKDDIGEFSGWGSKNFLVVVFAIKAWSYSYENY